MVSGMGWVPRKWAPGDKCLSFLHAGAFLKILAQIYYSRINLRNVCCSRCTDVTWASLVCSNVFYRFFSLCIILFIFANVLVIIFPARWPLLFPLSDHVHAPGTNVPLIHLLISALYIYRLLPHWSFFFFTFFPYLSSTVPYLSFPLTMEPLRFEAGRKRLSNLGVFVV